jgi:glycosyltransferase involved in cell wall biosynthesis
MAGRIVILCIYPRGTAAGQRFRWEQYVAALERAGHQVEVLSFWSPWAWRILYRPGHLVQKVAAVVEGFLRRLWQLPRALSAAHVFIHLEAAPLGPPFIEWCLFLLGRRVVYDIDDAIFISRTSTENRLAAPLRWRSKVPYITRRATRVTACNPFLVGWASQYNPNVVLVPTTIDETYHRRSAMREPNVRPVIGWTGTRSTIGYLDIAIPALLALQETHDFELRVIADKEFVNPGLRHFSFVPWSESREIADLDRFDIGLMPVPDSLWEKGKVGFKAIQYGAMGIVAVASHTGSGPEVIRDGVSGFLVANDVESWRRALAHVLDHPEQWARIGAAARSHIVATYSVQAQTPTYLGLFDPTRARPAAALSGVGESAGRHRIGDRLRDATRPKVAIVANSDWYLFNFRLSFAIELQRRGIDVLLLSPPGPYAARFAALGFRWRAVPFVRRSLNPYRELRAVWQMTRLLRQENVLLLHAFTIKCVVYGAIAARLAGVHARVYAIAGFGFVFSSTSRTASVLRPGVRALLRWALRDTQSRLILQNEDDAAMVRATGLASDEQVRVIRSSGVDLKRFAPVDREQRPALEAHVVLAARLLWDKGIGEFVSAARDVRAAYPGVRFTLAGDVDGGNPASVPRAVVEGWARDGVIDWLGHVDDMPALFASADIAVLPSYYGEGLPKSLIEAEAAGLPIITTDSPGCREVIEHGVHGLLVPPRDAQALAEAIAALVHDPVRRRAMGTAARRRAESTFDVRSVNERTIEVYLEVVDLPLARHGAP